MTLVFANNPNKQKKTNALDFLADVNIVGQAAAVHDSKARSPSLRLQISVVYCWLVNESRSLLALKLSGGVGDAK